MFPHGRTYLRLLREWARLDAMPRDAQLRARKTRVGCLILQIERRIYG